MTLIQGLAISDFQELNELKNKAHANSEEALPQAAKQFESIFLQALMKSMRATNQFLDENSLFSNKNQETYQEMLDSQYVSEMTAGKGLGVADMLGKQLARNNQTEAKPEAGLVSQPLRAGVGQALPVSTSAPVLKSSIEPIASKEEKSASPIKDFVKSIMPYAKEAANLIGLDPKILLAQAALETGWGLFMAKDPAGASSNNYFNVKASSLHPGEAVQVKTTEFLQGKPVKMTDSFRKYQSVADSFKDYVNLIKSSSRYQGALDHASDPERYIDELHRAGYATDPRYVQKILAIFHSPEFNQAMSDL